MIKLKILSISLLSALLFSACGTPAANIEITKSGKFKFITYSESNLQEAIDNDEIPLLYFYADWCPTCRALNKELIDKASEIPENLTILKIDYDTEKELKLKHEITIQHTLIQLDQNQSEVTRWIGGGVATLLQQLEQ